MYGRVMHDENEDGENWEPYHMYVFRIIDVLTTWYTGIVIIQNSMPEYISVLTSPQ